MAHGVQNTVRKIEFKVINGQFRYDKEMAIPIAVVGADLDLLDDLTRGDFEIVGYFSKQDKKIGHEYLGNHLSVGNLNPQVKIIVAVDDTSLREYIWDNHASNVTQYVSDRSSVSKYAKLGRGVVIYPHVFISAGVKIAELTKISVGSQIHHESQIGEFSVLAPKTLVLGRVHIGNHVFLGSNSSIAPNIQIGNRAFVGMCSNVVRNVEEGSKVWGNPAKPVRHGS